jgi:hypothetical protein
MHNLGPTSTETVQLVYTPLILWEAIIYDIVRPSIMYTTLC